MRRRWRFSLNKVGNLSLDRLAFASLRLRCSIAPLANLFVGEAVDGFIAPVTPGAESAKRGEVELGLVNSPVTLSERRMVPIGKSR